jgi:general secretion pathway protein L
MLIIALPHTPAQATSGYAHVHSDGQSVQRSATGVAATLSSHAGEVVAVVPHSRLSWLNVQLPPNSQGPRLHDILHGLLEDRLLDELDQLHIVPEPQAAATARNGGLVRVAVCDKQWLREVLNPLQAAGLTVQRLVPEFTPSEGPTLYAMGTPDHSQTVLTHQTGVTLLPPNTAQWPALFDMQHANLQIQAEPAMVERVQQLLQRQPMLQSAAQRWVSASQTRWNLAQGEWAQGRQQRLWRQLQAAWQTLRHAPAWRAVRVGALALLAVQVIGLNALAWREQRDLRNQQAALHTLLKNTFPSVSLVIDAPLQMQREVDVLKQRSGASANTDLEPLLAALGTVLPAGQLPAQLHFANQTLRIQGLALDTTQASAAQASLHSRGLSLRQENNDVWLLQAEAAR